MAIGNNLDAAVQNSETRTVGQNRQLAVGVNRTTDIGAVDTLRVDNRHTALITPSAGGEPTAITMVDKTITLDTGAGASITLTGAEVIIKADKIRILGEKEVISKVSQGDLRLVGGPMVKVNC